ncbi:MAG: LysM peptidoglycan-binding domain-containing protein [Candidatus Sungbacteria bacterium]|uniref:LysM peptidoglycan-binding domain-containing protein n=1 Tax=Candidatus Sungiibacteriota bacterium TaxID=2750080 RepID=A0A931SE95_9BACT|nr:LysM peptidoglycan-binding domain-containing protein [Candidatus Sungbacteria bacterium]
MPLLTPATKSKSRKPVHSRRPPLLFGRLGSVSLLGIASISFFLILFYPLPARAGFFSEIFKLFTKSGPNSDEVAVLPEIDVASYIAPVLAATPNPEAAPDDSAPDLNVIQRSAFMAPTNPLGTLQGRADQDQIFVYTVKPGDTPSAIAKTFGVSVNTIVWANQLRSPSAIQVGDQLLILPVSGVKYAVKKGDTIESIAKKYKGDAAEILAFNGLAPGAGLEIGDEIVIPDGELYSEGVSRGSSVARSASLPNIVGYFLRPIEGGRRSQGIHGRNGVDLANTCGSPIFASADGQVLIVRETGWNGGFGKFIVINHPNGTQTLYAHNLKNMVTVGEGVKRGQIIGLVGNTGNTRGATGCHVHFEIHGARNPF